jgi:hypothetical protein
MLDPAGDPGAAMPSSPSALTETMGDALAFREWRATNWQGYDALVQDGLAKHLVAKQQKQSAERASITQRLRVAGALA